LNIEGEKVSTSRNWAVWVDQYVRDFPGCEDVLRYVLCANAPETKDNDFTWKDFQERNNSELVAVFGNFVNRALVLMHKLCGGKVPRLHTGNLDELDKGMIREIEISKGKIEDLIEQYKFREALYEVIDMARKGNKYLQEKEPWKKATDDKLKAASEADQIQIDNCLHLCLQLTANLAILVNPFLPNTAKKMIYLLKVVEKMLEWENAGKLKLLKEGYSLRAPELLFRKIETAEVEAQIEKLHANSKLQNTIPMQEETRIQAGHPKATIQFEDFVKLDLKIATILTAEKVEKADKLLKLELDLGYEKRQVVSGIAQHFRIDEIIGKQVVLVANLAPRKMKGVESNGMILMAESADGKLIFVHPEEKIVNGATVS
jgi:methionyl-tRNA synthetase